jgi:prepilin-type N-terminal cleavage/methylation domain-containing protein
MIKRNIQKGFTLIELLVVISIIGLLASVVMSSVGEAKIKAENTKINQEVNSWITAIELYRLESGGAPLSDVGTVATACLGDGVIGSFTCGAATHSSKFKSQMADYIDTTKNPNRPSVTFGTGQQMAVYLYNGDGESVLHWFLYGDVDCRVGSEKKGASINTYCELNLDQYIDP